MAFISGLNIPSSTSAVRVCVIDTTSQIIAPLDMVTPLIEGHSHLNCPSYSFLIEHESGRRLLYDLGVRKDLEKFPPVIQRYFKHEEVSVSVEKEVHEILEEHGIRRTDIEGIIWSHWHWDHIGDPSKYEPHTDLIVGPGFTDIFIPGYPTNEGSPLLESDWAGRKLREISFDETVAVKIGPFEAHDYFGDGSFYILHAPGHTVGHLAGLARVTVSPATFVLMGGDCCHHSGEMRPSKHLPLPDSISPHPFKISSTTPCPGSYFDHLLRNGDRKRPFYDQKKPGIILCDPDVAADTIEKIQEADISGNVLVIIAHDAYMKGVIDFFPKDINSFAKKDWKERLRWAFLKDFVTALSVDD